MMHFKSYAALALVGAGAAPVASSKGSSPMLRVRRPVDGSHGLPDFSSGINDGDTLTADAVHDEPHHHHIIGEEIEGLPLALTPSRPIGFNQTNLSVKVGDEVCVTNYIMDQLCINLGYLLDDRAVTTLEEPEKHSFHCLLDVKQCVNSGFVVLTDKNNATGMHCLGYRIEDSQAVVTAGLAAGKKGYCTECTGDDTKPERGYRATIKGTVKDVGDGSAGIAGTPLLENVEVLDESVVCETPTVVEPVCMSSEEETPAPAPANEPIGDNCIKEMCEMDLGKEMVLRYQIIVPDGTTVEACEGCQVTMEVEYDGEAWVGIGFSRDGKMKGSEAVLGLPGAGGSVQKYMLGDYDVSAVLPLPETQQTLSDATVEIVDGKTVMKFTKIMKEDGEIEIGPGVNQFLWAHGSDATLAYHQGRSPFRLNLSGPPQRVVLNVGDEVCVANYVMDQFCINLGHLLDAPDVITLESPQEHSFHCLLDVPQCKDSGYVVLTDKDEKTGMHCLGYRLDNTQAVLDAGLAAGQKGYCTDCTGDASKPERGYRATIKGTIKELGDGSDGIAGTPLLTNVQVLDESVGCETTIVNPVCMAPESQAETPDDKTPATKPGPSKDCTKELCEEELEEGTLTLRYQINVPDGTTLDVCEGCTISMELECAADAWLAVGFSTDGQMVGSEAVIGLPDEDKVQKYMLGGKTKAGVTPLPESQQTLTDTSITSDGGNTVMKFTKIMKEPGEIEVSSGDNTFLWAYGTGTTLDYHGPNRKSFQLNLSSGASAVLGGVNKAAWLAHGIMGFIAWGVLVPFAVEAALHRNLLPAGPLWFQLHRAFNSTAFAMFVAFFAVAVAFTQQEGGTHFAGPHQKVGLAMFVLAVAQVGGGVLRPHLPAPDSGDPKTTVRKGWEVGHRVLGATLLAMAFWQIAKGIELYAVKYSLTESDERKLTIAYWVWIGLMTAIIVVGGALKLKALRANSEANSEKS